MESIKLSVLNDLLQNRHKYFVRQEDGELDYTNADKGYITMNLYDEYFKIYYHPELEKGVLYIERYLTDSYGEDLKLESSGFFKQETELITNFRKV